MSTSPALLENGCGYQLENTLYPNVHSIVALYYSTHVYSRPNICRRCSKVVFLFFLFFFEVHYFRQLRALCQTCLDYETQTSHSGGLTRANPGGALGRFWTGESRELLCMPKSSTLSRCSNDDVLRPKDYLFSHPSFLAMACLRHSFPRYPRCSISCHFSCNSLDPRPSRPERGRTDDNPMRQIPHTC